MATVNSILNIAKYSIFIGLFTYFGPSTFFLFKKYKIGIIFYIWFTVNDLFSIYNSIIVAPIFYILSFLLLVTYMIFAFITMREINTSSFSLKDTTIIILFTLLLSFLWLEFDQKISENKNFFIATYDLYKKHSKSMDDTLKAPALIIVSKKKKFQRGDIVNFQTDKSGGFLKRCVATSGYKFFFKDGTFHLIKKGEDRVIKEPFKNKIYKFYTSAYYF